MTLTEPLHTHPTLPSTPHTPFSTQEKMAEVKGSEGTFTPFPPDQDRPPARETMLTKDSIRVWIEKARALIVKWDES